MESGRLGGETLARLKITLYNVTLLVLQLLVALFYQYFPSSFSVIGVYLYQVVNMIEMV